MTTYTVNLGPRPASFNAPVLRPISGVSTNQDTPPPFDIIFYTEPADGQQVRGLRDDSTTETTTLSDAIISAGKTDWASTLFGGVLVEGPNPLRVAHGDALSEEVIFYRDSVAPTLSAASATPLSSRTGTLTVTTDEGNGYIHWGSFAAASGKTKTDIETGTGSSLARGSFLVTDDGELQIPLTAIAAGTHQYIHFFPRDEAGNEGEITVVDLTTVAAPALVDLSVVTNAGAALTTKSWSTGFGAGGTCFIEAINQDAFLGAITALRVNGVSFTKVADLVLGQTAFQIWKGTAAAGTQTLAVDAGRIADGATFRPFLLSGLNGDIEGTFQSANFSGASASINLTVGIDELAFLFGFYGGGTNSLAFSVPGSTTTEASGQIFSIDEILSTDLTTRSGAYTLTGASGVGAGKLGGFVLS